MEKVGLGEGVIMHGGMDEPEEIQKAIGWHIQT